MDIDDKAIANKSARVVSYLKYSDKTGTWRPSSEKWKHQARMLQMSTLLGFFNYFKYFNEEEDQMFHKVDQTTLPSEVDCAELPSMPCIVVCGMFEYFSFSVLVTVIILLL